MRAGDLALKPRTLDHVHAAAVPLSALTAWQALFVHAGLAAGQRILIHGAAGGVWAFAAQLARWRGAHVSATASARHHDFLRELGVETVIDLIGRPGSRRCSATWTSCWIRSAGTRWSDPGASSGWAGRSSPSRPHLLPSRPGTPGSAGSHSLWSRAGPSSSRLRATAYWRARPEPVEPLVSQFESVTLQRHRTHRDSRLLSDRQFRELTLMGQQNCHERF